MFHMLMMLMKFSFVPQHFFRFFFFMIRIRTKMSLSKSIKKVMLCVLKIPLKFSVIPQSFFQNQNPFQDQDHDFTSDFNTRPTISYIEETHQILCGSANSFESYCVHMKRPRAYVQPDIQPTRQTDRRKFFFARFVF